MLRGVKFLSPVLPSPAPCSPLPCPIWAKREPQVPPRPPSEALGALPTAQRLAHGPCWKKKKKKEVEKEVTPPHRVTRRMLEVAASGGDGPLRRDVSPKVMQLVRPCPEPRPLLLPSGKIREKFSSSRREKKKKDKKKEKKKKAKQTPRPLFGETAAAARSDGIYFALGNSIHSGSGCGREG